MSVFLRLTTLVAFLGLLVARPAFGGQTAVEVTSQHEQIKIGIGKKAPEYYFWQQDQLLSVTVLGPTVLELKIRPLNLSGPTKFNLTAVRDEAFVSTRSVKAFKGRAKTKFGLVSPKDVLAHLEVPPGKHQIDISLSELAAPVLCRVVTSARALPRLAFSAEVTKRKESTLETDTLAEITTPKATEPQLAAATPLPETTPKVVTAPPVLASSPKAVGAPEPAEVKSPDDLPEFLKGAAKRTFVVPLKPVGIDSKIAVLIQSELEARLGRFKNLVVVTPAEINALVKLARDQDDLGCESNSSCLAELGQVAEADLLISGNIGRLGEVLLLSLSLIEPKTGQILGRATVTGANPENLASEIQVAIEQTFGIKANQTIAKFDLVVPESGLKLAVMPLSGHGVEAGVGENLTQVVALQLKQLHGIAVISQDEIAAMLQLESAKDAVGCNDVSCFAEIGGALGVDYLVTGNVGLLGDTYLIGLKLIDTQEAQVANRVTETFKGTASDLIRAARFAVYQLVGAKVSTPGKLAVRVSPDEDFTLQLNDELVADMTKLAALPPGRHSLRIQASGYYAAYLETYVEPGLTNTVNLQLTAVLVPWYKRWWVWTIGVGVLAGGVTTLVLLNSKTQGAQTGTIELGLQKGLSHAR